MILNPRSEKSLIGVNPALVAVVRRAAEITDTQFIVTEGLRTKERQAQLVKAGASQTMNSKHLTGHAVDLAAVVDGEVRWDWPLYHKLAGVMLAAAKEVGTPITWGGSWKTFPDGPHFQLG
jgi:peptidoglycan L-alanyl-D-glutamate endopeptidase CwlK